MTDRSVRVRLSLTHSDFSRGLATVAAQTSAFGKNLDTADSSFSRLVSTGLALGPSLVPVMGAVAAGGIGLAESLGATALGAGVAVLAFQGVGDALKALNDFQLAPTEAHLEKVRQTMAAVGPDGQRFVMMLQDLRPQLQDLQDTARAGLLPGVTEGLDQLLDAGPHVESLVSNISTALGSLADDAGGALSSPFWTDFLDFLGTEGRDSMVTMLQIIGQLTKAAASLVMAFDPLSADIGNSLLDKAEAFARWSAELDQTQGFQSFLDYIHDVGPEVWDTLASLGEALVDITKAAAPVGRVSLPIIQAIAETLSAIASSPAGPILIGVAAGINAISRAVALYNAASGSALGALLFGGAGKGGLLSRTGVTAQAAGIRAAAGAIGLLALSFTDLDDSMGLKNTATFAALGFGVGGTIGAGIGAIVGQVQDLRAATGDLSDAFSALDTSTLLGLDQSDFDQRVDDINAKIDSVRAHQVEILGAGGSFIQEHVPGGLGIVGQLVGDTDDAEQQLQDLIDKRDSLLNAPHSTLLTGPVSNLLGSVQTALDSGSGHEAALIGAVRALDNQVVSTTTHAEALSNALDELLDPNLNLEAATDAYTTALRHWEDELAKSNRTLKGNSDAAIQNRAAIRSRVGLLKDQLAAEAAAGWGSERLTNSMERQRGRLLDAAAAAGLNRKAVRELLSTYDLTPKLIRTLIEANTESAMNNISALKRYLATLHDKTINITTIQNTATNQQAAYQARKPRAYGGQVFGPGGPRDDMVPIAASNREWVQPVDAVDYYGEGFMHAVQHKLLPRMADGGSVAWYADGMPVGSRVRMPYYAAAGAAGSGRSRIVSGELRLDESGRVFIRAIAEDVVAGDRDFEASAARQRGR